MDETEDRLQVRALFVGARIDVRDLEKGSVAALPPLTIPLGERGHAVVFRFGAVVLFDVEPDQEGAFLASLAPRIASPFEEPESEELEVRLVPDGVERLEPSGDLVLHRADLGRLQVVAQVLAKSTVLAHYEQDVAAAFDRIEGLATDLRRGSQSVGGRELRRQIGDVLLIQARTVGRVEVTEKPEITWDDPELDRLYERLAAEYELRDRDIALSRKLELIADTARTHLDLRTDRNSIRLEWYIVILIAAEIVLILYDIFWAHS